MAFCTNCGSKINDDAKFCSVCGKQVIRVVPPVPDFVPEPVQEQVPSQEPMVLEPMMAEPIFVSASDANEDSMAEQATEQAPVVESAFVDFAEPDEPLDAIESEPPITESDTVIAEIQEVVSLENEEPVISAEGVEVTEADLVPDIEYANALPEILTEDQFAEDGTIPDEIMEEPLPAGIPAAPVPMEQPGMVTPPMQPGMVPPPMQPGMVTPPMQPGMVPPPMQPGMVPPPVQSAQIPPAQAQVNAEASEAPPKGSPYAVVSTGGFILAWILFMIPLVGPIVCIIWTFGGAKNKNRRNMARACFILSVICIVLTIIFCIFMMVAFRGPHGIDGAFHDFYIDLLDKVR